jgi:type III secretory pathway component EscU
MARQRTQFQSKDLTGNPSLRRPLNDFAIDVQTRLEAVETSAGLTLLPPVEVALGGTYAAGTAPFPLLLSVPKDARVKGVLVVAADNLTAPGTTFATALYPSWRIVDRKLEVGFVTGLAVSTTYRLTLALVG